MEFSLSFYYEECKKKRPEAKLFFFLSLSFFPPTTFLSFSHSF